MAVAPCGCGTFVGGSALIPVNGAPVQLGPSIGHRSYFGRSEGFLLGGVATAGLPERRHRDSSRLLAEARLGYGNVPWPTKCHFGFEAWLGPALGWAPANKDSAVGWTLGFGVPYRMSRNQQPWEVAEKVAVFPFIQPSFSLMQLVPTAGDLRVDSTFVASLVV
ncbi:MAG TPA: hypothetical protein VEQ59_15095, partial [Polyangiaceae bacterium]|nr:hypothetical protein [Polyangiaceae bacterium]